MPNGHHHLTRDQRCQISTLISMHSSQKFISEKLGVHRSTISRELKRNKSKRGYQHEKANNLSVQRRQHASTRPRRMTLEMRALKLSWKKNGVHNKFLVVSN